MESTADSIMDVVGGEVFLGVAQDGVNDRQSQSLHFLFRVVLLEPVQLREQPTGGFTGLVKCHSGELRTLKTRN